MERGKYTIVIADDDPSFLAFAARTLGDAGYRVIQAGDGQHALQEALTKKVNLIFLDVSMPQLGGVQACHCLKAMPKTSGIPVIITASKKDPQAKTLAEHMQGSVKILRKPLDEGEIVQTADSFLLHAKTLV